MIIGLIGKAQAGKDTVGAYLVEHYGYKRIALADKVKEIAIEQFGWDGQKDEKGRRLLQLIGTEVGRGYNLDIWVRHLDTKLGWSTTKDVVVTDVRFHNEANYVKTHGGMLVRVTGRGGLSNTGGTHPSEVEQETISADYTLHNESSLTALYDQIDILMGDTRRESNGS